MSFASATTTFASRFASAIAPMGKTSLKQLPALATHERALELCVYCPKLCRSECPVSNAKPSEALTPWGKMSSTYFIARGDVAVEPSLAVAPWACTGCGACTQRCDHKNDVSKVLFDARAALRGAGALPPSLSERPPQKTTERAPANKQSIALIVGCSYGARETADAIAVAQRLASGPVVVVPDCCGRNLEASGEPHAFESKRAELSEYLGQFSGVLVADAGCAETLIRRYPKQLSVSLLLSLALRELARLGPLPPKTFPGPVRFHDPCALGRSLGEYEAPRALLTKILGETPAEFPYARERAHCSGGGGLLPLTMPEVAGAIAQTRCMEHESAGGGTIVTACAASLAMFRAADADAVDLVTFLRQSLEAAG
jgi:dimethylglycine catabolism B